jgi:membrane protease YdiL (CAAX protease family)
VVLAACLYLPRAPSVVPMTTISPSASRHGTVRPFVRRHPVTAFSVGALGLGWPLLGAYTAFGIIWLGPVFTYGALLGSALLVTALVDGTAGVRRLLLRLLLWRFGIERWAVVVLAMPVLTLGVAAVTGTLRTPVTGWGATAWAYLFATFVSGALAVNLAEETAWSGFVQTRLAGRHGLLKGALLTAPLFAAMHLPLQFTPGWTGPDVAIGTAALLVMTPFFRYLMGDLLASTGGSLLATGIAHASFNAANELGLVGNWQALPALAVLVAALAVTRRVTERRRTSAEFRLLHGGSV